MAILRKLAISLQSGAGPRIDHGLHRVFKALWRGMTPSPGPEHAIDHGFHRETIAATAPSLPQNVTVTGLEQAAASFSSQTR